LLSFFPFGLFKVQLNNRCRSVVSSRNKAGKKKGNEEKKDVGSRKARFKNERMIYYKVSFVVVL
jgi:hypothetical protein